MIERQKLVDDLRATGDSVRSDAEQLDAIEAEKARLEPDDPRAAPLAERASSLGDRIAAKAHTEEALVDALRATDEGASPGDDAEPA